jgi:hypothetical protein
MMRGTYQALRKSIAYHYNFCTAGWLMTGCSIIPTTIIMHAWLLFVLPTIFILAQ